MDSERFSADENYGSGSGFKFSDQTLLKGQNHRTLLVFDGDPDHSWDQDPSFVLTGKIGKLFVTRRSETGFLFSYIY